MATAVAPVIIIPATVEEAPVEESVLIEFPDIVMTGDVLELVIPVTLPPVPVDDKFVMVLLDTVNGLPLLPELPKLIPVIAPCPVILFMVFVETEEVVPPMYV